MTAYKGEHVPVLINEMLELAAPADGKVYVDCTFGAGGYSRALLASADCKVIALDRDPDVQNMAQELIRESSGRLQFIASNFARIEESLAEINVKQVDAIIMDLGVSTMQLKNAERGFSFMHDALLDMRMSKDGQDAADLVNNAEEQELADIIYRYGGERKSRQIAHKIVLHRQKVPITRTSALASIVHSVLGKKSGKIDSATRTFQALRIYINDELGELREVLAASERLLRVGGRLIVVSFHSLEDSMVKEFLQIKSGATPGESRHVPMRVEKKQQEVNFKLLTRRAIKPTEEEINSNQQSRSARLRAAEKIGEPKNA